MEDAPLPIMMTPKEAISKSFEIKQEENNYKLNIIIVNQNITLDLSDEKDLTKKYEIKLTLSELKQIHKIFSMFNSPIEFIDFMKALIDNKKLSIKPSIENKISIEFTVEYLYKQNVIKIDLIQKKVNFELISQDLCKKISTLTENYINLDNNYKKILEENKQLKEENKNIKDRLNNLENNFDNLKKCVLEMKEKNINNETKNLNIFDSVIMETKEEFDMVASAVKLKMNKEIKEMKKIYQATKDGGGDPAIFHQKCDNIPNTLVLFKSRGKRRFGAFVSLCWKSEGFRSIDKNCFTFSLDKKKIYYTKNNNNYEITYYKNEGQNIWINVNLVIAITGNPIKEPSLRTNESKFKNIFDYNDNALSEDGLYEGIYADEYEVFQILF